METMVSRPYAGHADLQPATDLVLKCRAVEGIDPWPPIDDLRQHLCMAGHDRSVDVRLWERRTGELAAIATIWEGMALIFCIHPEELSEELTTEILGWGLEYARALGRRRGEQPALFVPIRADDRQAVALLARHGFAPEEWELLRMIRPLAEPIAAPRFPNGFTLRRVSSARELAAATEIYQEVFVAGASIVGDRLALAGSSDHIQAIDLVAVAPDGAFAAFCLCTAGARETARPGHREGWIDLVGTRQAYRRLGLGRAVLLAGLRQLKSFGADQALLGTASWNVAAQRLFAAEGFRLLHQVRWYAWAEET